MSDRGWIYTAAFVRALGTGMIGVLLGLYLASRGLDATHMGLVVAAGLAGGAVAALVVTAWADRLGRRRSFLVLAALAALGALGLAFASSPAALLLASFAGMVNGMGRDRGAALVLEQAVLPATTTDAGRTLTFARYNVLQDAGHALGGLLAGLPALLGRAGAGGEAEALRVSVLVYAVLALLPLVAYARLSPGVETRAPAAGPRLTPESRRILVRISSLFTLDSLGGGFLTTALVSYFFHERFGVGAATLGPLFFVARAANAASHLAAARLARKIGLVNTMVFTHLPSSFLLLTVAYAPSFPIAAALFLVREGLVEMDVPTRQSYVMAMVRPEERTIASGVTHLVRLGAWAVAPALAGVLMQGVSLAVPLLAGAGLKIVYDLLLWRAFGKQRPPEEKREGRA